MVHWSDEMATDLPSSYNHADEEYIDMEVSSCSNLCCSTSSSPQSREFEFQMSSNGNDKGPTTSPADELFYKGKLLPLHLPPRLQMVQTLLHSSSTSFDSRKETSGEENYTIPFLKSSTAPCTNTTTPLDSCNISPSESCRVSCELNPDEHFFEWSTEMSSFIDNHPKKSWSRKLRLIKQSLIGQKLKASRAFLKSFFSKSACSDESCAKAAPNLEAEQDSRVKDCSSNYIMVGKRAPFGHIEKGPYPTLANILKSIDREVIEDNVNNHRKSFSGAIKRHSPTKGLSSSSSSSSGASSSSSSFSFNSSGFYELHFLKRSSSATSEIEGSIEAAIAHCKRSQDVSNSTFLEAGFCLLSASKIAASEEKRLGVCSI